MEEIESLTGAAHGERSVDRITQCNGDRDRVWETRAVAPSPQTNPDPLGTNLV